ncbi:MAG: flagellar hook basal-body protein [Myxococcota bacterium]|jgi:flagellar basal-body rod protein FlgF|nr:flagellar hook basal-body protein [Myxococcota bacterium]
MGNGIYTALSGALTGEHRLDVLSHNVANINTTAFKKIRSSFEEVLGPSKNKELSFANTARDVTDYTAGPIISTGNPLDVALVEGTHLAVRDGNSTAYVRGGTLSLLPSGRVSTINGQEVLGEDGPIQIPPGVKTITLGPTGEVIADEASIGRLRLVEFSNPGVLLESSGGTLKDPGNAGARRTQAVAPVMAGYLESSNAKGVENIIEMITAQRHYDAMSKVIQNFSNIEKRAAKDIAGRA